MMAHVDYVLAVVTVSDIEVGRSWYTKLFGREPDNNPMSNLIEWQVTNGAWVQVTEDPERAGNGCSTSPCPTSRKALGNCARWG
jgi:hypothetical protein